jgi:lipoprotein NlpI
LARPHHRVVSRKGHETCVVSSEGCRAEEEQTEHCEAYFFLGEYALLQGKEVDAVLLFREAIATGATNNLAYSGAQAELKYLTPQ